MTRSPNGDYAIHMETNTDEITSATITNILVGIVRKGSSKSSLAKSAGIPLTTFSRKINGHGDFTLRELGDIAKALDLVLADILPIQMIAVKVPA